MKLDRRNLLTGGGALLGAATVACVAAAQGKAQEFDPERYVLEVKEIGYDCKAFKFEGNRFPTIYYFARPGVINTGCTHRDILAKALHERPVQYMMVAEYCIATGRTANF